MPLKKILIIDDDISGSCLLKLSLEKTGAYEVRTENRGSRGLASAREFGPDAIVLDVVMPDKDGGDVAFQIQSDKTLRETPIIFLTSLVTDQEAAMTLLPGFQFMAKPVNVNRLVKLIEESLVGKAEVSQLAPVATLSDDDIESGL